ncbi:MAG TPA: AAA family ATPase [Bacteroidia bacterium]|jgi:energy-coupling factor transporter ATP-binding protein EcfA2|nr:AAA family ATPase [Bacteroidia bacterium]
MKYKEFIIQNYKGVNTVEIDLKNNRILTLVGLNESGKTTILEAINVFYNLTKGKDLPKERINLIRPKGTDFTGEVIIGGTMILEDVDKRKLEDYWKTRNKLYKITIPDQFSYSFKFKYELHEFKGFTRECNFLPVVVGQPKMLHQHEDQEWQNLIDYIRTNLTPEILYYEDFIFDIPDEIKFPLKVVSPTPTVLKIPTIGEEKNKTWQLVLDDMLKTSNSKYESFKKNIIDIWDTDNETAINRISQIESLLDKKITNSWKELFQKKNNALNFKEIKLNCNKQGDSINVSFKVKTDSGKLFSINERSKGCKWFFSFLIFTEFRKNRTDNILFLLDEPASNLHSSAQKKILEAIYELSNKSMVIYSTHSHHLINPAWLSGAFVVVNDKLSDADLIGEMTFDDSAKISCKKYFKYIGDGDGSVKVSYFQPILDALEYTPSAIEPIPNIVITEGKFDWYAFKYFSEIVFGKKHQINLYPGAGKDQLYDIIRLYLSWGKDFLVILDGDIPGQQAKKKYVEEFGEYIRNKVFTIKDILGLEADLEGLFEDSDKEKIIKGVLGNKTINLIDRGKTKSQLNLAISHLLVDKKQINMGASTSDNFNRIFEFIHKKQASK